MRGFVFSIILVLACLPVCSAQEAEPCATPGAVTSAPMNAATSDEASATLTWQAATGASFYVVYLGPTDPPNLYAEGVTGTSLAVGGLADGTTYYWYVVAHAECDPTLTSRTATQQLTTAGNCQSVGSFALTTPSSGASNVPNLVELQWSAAAGAASYDLHLGRTENPALVLSGITETSIEVPRLLPSTTYHWKVVARSACNASCCSTPVTPPPPGRARTARVSTAGAASRSKPASSAAAGAFPPLTGRWAVPTGPVPPTAASASFSTPPRGRPCRSSCRFGSHPRR